MTERDGIIADAWNDHITEKNERDWRVYVKIDLQFYLTADKDVSDEELMEKVLERLNEGYEFDESEVEITDAYTD